MKRAKEEDRGGPSFATPSQRITRWLQVRRCPCSGSWLLSKGSWRPERHHRYLEACCSHNLRARFVAERFRAAVASDDWDQVLTALHTAMLHAASMGPALGA